jgi:hypothetical protein
MEAPLTPYWEQPSHPSIQKVIFASKDEFLTKSISRIDLPPYALYAKMAFPPCSTAEKATYATVQMSADQHLNLNSDLVYINHSCDPSLVSAPPPYLLSLTSASPILYHKLPLFILGGFGLNWRDGIYVDTRKPQNRSSTLAP